MPHAFMQYVCEDMNNNSDAPDRERIGHPGFSLNSGTFGGRLHLSVQGSAENTKGEPGLQAKWQFRQHG